jgi:dienelactone hydrolase
MMIEHRFRTVRRREFLGFAIGTALEGADAVMRPAVSEAVCPIERISPIAQDGHAGIAFMRKPPGKGPFPSVVIIHGGLYALPEKRIREIALDGPPACRFLAAGYVVTALTYRSRDLDPQDKACLRDCLAVVDYLKGLPFVDPKSVVIYGCSGGGDLALEIAAVTEVCAIVPEEPASHLLAGIYNTSIPKKGERYTPADSTIISENPRRYYTPEFQKLTRAKLARIQCPILILQGDIQPINHFNEEVLIPELRALGKKPEVLTYSGEPHCFCFFGEGAQTPHPDIALKAFTDMQSFCQRHVGTKPQALKSNLVQLVPVKAATSK